MIQPCIDLALGRAFTPDSQDMLVSLARRFARRPLLAVTMYKDGVEAMPVTFAGGQPKFGTAEFSNATADDADANFLRTVAAKYKARDCVINVTTGYTATLSSRTRRAESPEEALLLMRDNPDRMLGEPAAHACRHSIAFHPTHSFAVVFAHRESDISAAAGLAARAELRLARVQCGMASLLMYVLGKYWAQIQPEAELLFADRGSVFHVSASEGGLGRPLFDVGLKETALKQALTERVGKLRADGKVLLVDTSGLDVAAMIAERGGLTVLEPMKAEAHPALLACCSDEPQLGYDLFPGERDVRPFAPARLRIVPAVFWAAVAATAAVVGVNTVREARAKDQSEGYKAQTAMLDAGKTHQQHIITDIKARAKTAQMMYDWLEISPPTQHLLMQITSEIEASTREAVQENRPVAQVDSLSVSLAEGQPQMRVTVVLLGDASAANRVFQRISALFSRLGYSTVDLKQTLVPQGFRYEHLLNMPKILGS